MKFLETLAEGHERHRISKKTQKNWKFLEKLAEGHEGLRIPRERERAKIKLPGPSGQLIFEERTKI